MGPLPGDGERAGPALWGDSCHPMSGGVSLFPLPLLSQSCHQCLEVMQQGERSPNKGLKGLLTNCISNQLVSLAAPQGPPRRLRGQALFSSSRKGKEGGAKAVVAGEQH